MSEKPTPLIYLAGFDAEGFAVEDFGLPRNLMLACSWVGVSATAEEGVVGLARYLAVDGGD